MKSLNCHLYTESGDFVATVQIPPFKKLPGVLIWGTRVFKFSETLDFFASQAEANNEPAYVEAFTWAVIDLEPPHGIPGDAV